MKGRTDGRLTGHDRAASSIIGLKILVAITVLMALPVGAYALDMSGVIPRPAHSTSFDITTNTVDNVVTVRHTGGETLAANSVKVVVTDGTNTLVYRSVDNAPLSADGSFAIDTNTTVFSGWSGATFTVQSATSDTPTPGGDDDGDDDDGDDDDDDDDGDDTDTDDESTGFVFTTGDRLTVKIIDTDSQTIILETTVDA